MQAKAATNTLQSLGLIVAAAAGYGSFISIKHLSTISNQKNKMQCEAYLAAAGFAIDRLEGDGIKINSWFTTPLGEALAARLPTKEAVLAIYT